MAVATSSTYKDNKKSYPHYLSRFLHYSMVWTVAIGRGGYFGLNMFALVFGGFFGKFTSTIALSIQATLGILSTTIFLGIFSGKEYLNQSEFELLEKELAELEENFIYLTSQNKEYQKATLTHCKENIPKKISPEDDNWGRYAKRWYFRAYNHTFEFLNSGKDFVKGLIMTASMYGLAVPVVMSAASTPVFIAFCAASIVFSVCSAMEYHLNKARDRDQKHLKQKKFFLEREFRNFEKLSSVEKQNYKFAEKKRDETKKPKEAYNLSPKPRYANRMRLAIATTFGLLNGLYFGLTMDDIFTNVITAYATPLPVSVTIAVMWGGAWMINNFTKEYKAQDAWLATMAKYHRNQKKWSDEIKDLSKAELAQLPSSKAKQNLKNVEFKNADATMSDHGIDVVEAGRAATNATKLITLTLQILGAGVATQLGVFGTFGILPTVALTAFAASTAFSGIAMHDWESERKHEIKFRENKISWMKKDLAYLKKHPDVPLEHKGISDAEVPQSDFKSAPNQQYGAGVKISDNQNSLFANRGNIPPTTQPDTNFTQPETTYRPPSFGVSI